MEVVKVSYESEGNSLTIWFREPSKKYNCETIENDIILIKSSEGEILGLRKLNYSKEDFFKRQIIIESNIH